MSKLVQPLSKISSVLAIGFPNRFQGTFKHLFQAKLEKLWLSGCTQILQMENIANDERIMSVRQWEHVKPQGSKPGFIFSLMSYNILAQDLLEKHPHLYRDHYPKVLEWEFRWNNLLKEITKFNPDIVCLQEVQESHMHTYFSVLEALGYTGIYKRRTGIRVDGCAIYYNANLKLIDHIKVEFLKPSVALLNRDNIGLIAKFAPKNHPSREFIIATTHLLYNPKRNDVRAEQMKLFFAEIDRLSCQQQFGKYFHIPVIIAGDLNTQPNSELYYLITSGEINYGSFLEEFDKQHSGPSVSDSLGRTSLTANFSFRSVYDHGFGENPQVTTYQDEWLTVDYIFYSVCRDHEKKQNKLNLLSRWRLPTKKELYNIFIPNNYIGSDHLSLLAKFKLEF